MGSLKEIRNRIKTVKSTRKITSAMSRIAAARLVKAQNTATAARPYGERLEEVVRDLLGAVDSDATVNPLLAQREVASVGLVLITADRGLCGGFNANANRAARGFLREQRAQGREVAIISCGRKGKSYLQHEGEELAKAFEAPELTTVVERAKDISSVIAPMFSRSLDTGLPHVDAVYMIYNHFRSVLTQEVRTVQVLPFKPVASEAVGPAPVFEPDPRTLLSHLLPVALESRIQQALFNSVASEIAARRMAMNSATDNASELIGELTLQYNRERQAAITKELMEIIGGAEALKG